MVSAGLLLAGLLVSSLLSGITGRTTKRAQALGRAINISRAPFHHSPLPGSTELTFRTEKERAQRAIEEFEKVAAKYGDPYRSESRYFIASNRLVVDRQKGISELTELSNSSIARSGGTLEIRPRTGKRERRQARRCRDGFTANWRNSTAQP